MVIYLFFLFFFIGFQDFACSMHFVCKSDSNHIFLTLRATKCTEFIAKHLKTPNFPLQNILYMSVCPIMKLPYI